MVSTGGDLTPAAPSFPRLLRLVWAGRAHPTKGVLAAIALFGIASAALGALAAERGFDSGHDLYRVSAQAGAVYLPAVEMDPAFEVTFTDDPVADVRAGAAELGLFGGRVVAGSSSRGVGALTQLEAAVRAYEDATLPSEADEDAAYPLHVEVITAPRSSFDPRVTPPADGDEGGSSSTVSTASVPVPADGSLRASESAAGIEPPVPFRGLLLVFAYLIPANVVAQGFGSRLVRERLNERIMPLLSAPVSRTRLACALFVPPLLGLVLLAIPTTILVGAPWIVAVLLFPTMVLFIAIEFVAGLLARSYSELTFLTAFIGTALATLVFVPALFAGVHPIALLSPVTPALQALDGRPVDLFEFALPLLPILPVTLAAFALASRLLREEYLLHPGPRATRIVHALAHPPPTGVRLLVYGMLAALVSLPVEGLAVGLGLVAPQPLRFVALIALAALIEESLKGAPVLAAVHKRRGPWTGLKAAALVGLGFFLAEKGLQAAGLAASYVSTGDLPDATGIPLVFALLPLALHVTAPQLTALGGSLGGRRGALVGVAAATSVHAAYNILVVRLVS